MNYLKKRLDAEYGVKTIVWIEIFKKNTRNILIWFDLPIKGNFN